MTQTVGTAVATQQQPTPAAMVKRHMDEFAKVLPSHLKPETWVRVAQGALKKGKPFDANKPDGPTELEQAALNDPRKFMATLLDAARLGLDPGTEQYYLTPRKVKNKLEILGIVGYQGIIELMYRAGAISSVVAEVVYSNDKFTFQPGRDEIPNHEIDWDGNRGTLRLVYAFARMKDGAISRVVVLNKADIARIKESSQGANSEYSPWVRHEAAMWLKSAVRQLSKWVPTSPEYMREQLRSIAEVRGEVAAKGIEPRSLQDIDPEPDWVDGQVVEETTAVQAPPVVVPQENAVAEPKPTDAQLRKLHAQLNQIGVTEDAKHGDLTFLLGRPDRPISSTKELSRAEMTTVIDLLERVCKDAEPARAYSQLLAELADADRSGEPS